MPIRLARPPAMLHGLLASAAIIVAACSPTGAGPSPTPGGEVVATLSEWAIGLSSSTAPSGQVKFAISNEGTQIHEFLIIRTDMMAADMPVKDHMLDVEAMGGAMDTGMDMPGMSPEGGMEHPAGTVGEVEDIVAGATTQLVLDNLEPGHYAIVCDIPTHYEQGMHTDFTVGG